MPRSQADDSRVTLPASDHYHSMHAAFRWHVPERFNMAQVCCGRWAADPATAGRAAIIADGAGLVAGTHSYAVGH